MNLLSSSAVVLLVSVSLAACESESADAGNAISYTSDSFKENVGQQNHFVMFYAPWCGHCKRLKPTWEDLAKQYNEKEERDVVIAKVDCTVETALCSEHDVTGYPTLKFFKKDEDAEKYRGARDLDSLTKFINKKMGLATEEELYQPKPGQGKLAKGKIPPLKDALSEPEEAKVEKGLYILSDKSFANHIRTGDHFIKFYAPWCGHCQKLAPTWEELAAAFATDDSVKIAKLDCTQAQSICQENDVKGYPTLHFYRNGKKLESYRGARNLDDLKDFVKSMQEEKAKASAEGDTKDKVPTEDASSHVYVINSDTFQDKIKSGLTFVKFYAPWCGHCKRLAPVWDDLASKLRDRTDKITIAKVDCTSNESKNKELCDQQEVNGFPTLNLYKDGKKVEEYSGKRSLDDLVTFVEKHLEGKPKDEL